MGQNARVKSGATSSVALGKDSVATEPNTVSVGSTGKERRITNVDAGVNSTDAVNKAQVDAVNGRVSVNANNIARNAGAITENRNAIQQNSADIQQNSTDIDHNQSQISGLHQDMEDAYAGIAAAAALVTVMPSKVGKTTVNIGLGNFKSQNAAGITIAHRLKSALFSDQFSVNAGVSYANGNVLSRVGGTWEF